MKKIAGTLKLDQAQYRELEAFSKFGSDLDAATMAVLNKGERNVEILKQGQFQPFKVEDQIAIIYCGTKGLLNSVPVNRIKEFEKLYLDRLNTEHKEVLQSLKEGKLSDDIESVMRNLAEEISVDIGE
jgi:F-type H+-transporting ATPase subunit alpha